MIQKFISEVELVRFAIQIKLTKIFTSGFHKQSRPSPIQSRPTSLRYKDVLEEPVASSQNGLMRDFETTNVYEHSQICLINDLIGFTRI